MRFRGVHHVEFNVLVYEISIRFYDRMCGFFADSNGIKWELAHFSYFPSPRSIMRFLKLARMEKEKHPEWKRHPFFEAQRKLPGPGGKK